MPLSSARTKNRDRLFLFLMIAAMTLAIVITRMISLEYNRYLHPDEHVFYFAANSMANAILNPHLAYEEFMEYPEGAYLFYMPFQILGKVVSRLLHWEPDLQLWGRVAAVVYYILAAGMGMRLVHDRLGKTKAATVIYGITAVFSLFFIEQSRYGTGDMISLMLLMLIITLTDIALKPNAKGVWWVVAFFAAGVMGAVKYPLILFAVIPISAYFHQSNQKMLRKVLTAAGALGVVLAGFLVFSPKAVTDLGYILRVIQREGNVYVNVGSGHEQGGPLNHLAAMLVYSGLYSDFPLMLPFVGWGFFLSLRGFVQDSRQGEKWDGQKFLFYALLPAVCIFFFTYNLFVKQLFFRTYTPYFGLMLLYVPVVAEKLYLDSKAKRGIVIVLSALMILRGGFLVYALSDQQKVNDLVTDQINQAVGEAWNETYTTSMFTIFFPPDDSEAASPRYLEELPENSEGGLEIQPGQLVITGAYQYHLGRRYLFPVGEEATETIAKWEAFDSANRQWFRGQAYPDYYYYLFGGWIRGNTLSQYDFPCNRIYYRE